MLANAFRKAEGTYKEEFGDSLMLKAFEPFNLIGAADLKLVEKREIPVPDQHTIYRVSGLSRMCPMEEYLRYAHHVQKFEVISAQLKRTFDFGNAFHSVTQNNWFGAWGWLVGDWRCHGCGKIHKDMFRPKQCDGRILSLNLSGGGLDLCKSEEFTYVELSLEAKDLFLTGHPDGILRLECVDYTMELKSASSKSYNWIEQKKIPYDAHRDQVNLYSFLLKKKHGLIIYFDKDESRWMQFYEPYDEARVQKQLNKITVVKESIKNNRAPVEHKMCASNNCDRARACPVRKQCFT